MAGGGNFVNRVLSYVVNEVVVNGLANSVVKLLPWRYVVADSVPAAMGRNAYYIRCRLQHHIYMADPAFQRFAVRTSKRIEDISSKAVQKQRELADKIKDLSENIESFKKQ